MAKECTLYFVGGIHLFVSSLEALKARITNLLESENDLMEWGGYRSECESPLSHSFSPVHQDHESPSSTHRQQAVCTRKVLRITKLPAEGDMWWIRFHLLQEWLRKTGADHFLLCVQIICNWQHWNVVTID